MVTQRTDASVGRALAPAQEGYSRLPSLTGLRFLAAFMVFVTHVLVYTTIVPGHTGDQLRKAFTLSGSYGVGFFFILSGFVLTWTAQSDDTAPSFWRRRLVKIGPMHLVTFGLAALMVADTNRPTRTVDWIASGTMQQSWFRDVQTVSAVNGVTWSMTCEFFFYLSFPVLLFGLRRISEKWLWPTLATVLALIVGVFLIATYVVSDQPRLALFGVSGVSFSQVWLVYFFPPVRALEFVLGIVLARIVAAGRWPRFISLAPAFVLAAGGYVLAVHEPYLAGSAGVGTVLTAPLIAAAAVADRQGAASVFRRRPMVFLGEISFAFYMVHWIILVETAHLIGTRTFSLPTAVFLVIGLLVVICLAAFLLYRCVETPLVRRFGRRHLNAGRTARSPGADGLRVPAGEASAAAGAGESDPM
ncbi:Peptidoglycan/LPS O-acetylase OafA/YrhL, contains acyltransferase and SGNH-hydrolase domains [Actinacidiphila yanglinensis]|uniref:Peptidoglycan/LPS O-acetylase OafA/YrhL, contains acyltransferase and SGNH-hydrolase domains n=1 Tax=Actinacidiphila yanglinensis TaxID=310779 RepID=A0A1H6E358_9ACTN|nr:acyltransferase [Actinacidiphila yanglinensis]SEG91759.1 Peptidoglycan/LPS O-acetylase OafA/YrhL, contains acyltransferase and SGNH-hydrolase domains [Actinacidiphila yanglinensis]